MTEPGGNDQRQPEPTQDPVPTPTSQAGAWDKLQPRTETLATWISEQDAAFTISALEASAIESGYTKAEFAEAVRLKARREREHQVITPLRWRARLVVILGYLLVWVFFGIQYMVLPWSGGYVTGSFLQTILTISLVVAFLISLAWIHVRRPDPDRVGRALAILLVVPVVLLVGVAGLCLPFIPAR